MQLSRGAVLHHSIIYLQAETDADVRSLGTCCGSTPSAGLESWLSAGGIGIDTANDYDDQGKIAQILHPWLAANDKKRSDVFITTKIPAGFGGAATCKADPSVALDTLKQVDAPHPRLPGGPTPDVAAPAPSSAVRFRLPFSPPAPPRLPRAGWDP